MGKEYNKHISCPDSTHYPVCMVHWSVTVQSDSALAQTKEGFQCLEYHFWLLKCDITSLVASQLFHIVKLLMPLSFFHLGFWNKICLCRVIPWKRSVPEISAFFSLREWWEGHLFQECPALRVLPNIQHWHKFFPFCSVISGRYLPGIMRKMGKKKARLFEKWNAHWSRWTILCNKMPSKYTTNSRAVLYILKVTRDIGLWTGVVQQI